VDSPGDNLLAEFPSVVDAVNCAAEIQRDLAARNAKLPEDRRMAFRIGAALTLAEIGPGAKQAVPALKDLLTDEDKIAREGEEVALKKIQGEQ
jgi:hypothetical protein